MPLACGLSGDPDWIRTNDTRFRKKVFRADVYQNMCTYPTKTALFNCPFSDKGGQFR